MNKKTKGLNGGDRPTQKTPDGNNPTAIRSSIKAIIVRLAIYGLIPAGLATYLIQRGGLKHE